MRFAWLRIKRETAEPPAASRGERVLFVSYNILWWVPVALPPLGLVSYRVGVLSFLATTMVRAVVNFFRNNILSVEAAERFPLRSP